MLIIHSALVWGFDPSVGTQMRGHTVAGAMSLSETTLLRPAPPQYGMDARCIAMCVGMRTAMCV